MSEKEYILKLKRGKGKPSSLQKGEPAVDLQNKRLYIGGENNEILKIESGIGKNTEAGGEIFNNYTENIANQNSHAEGSKTEATGENSHAQNRKAKAYGKHSHAQNYDTLAQGESSSAMGVQTKAYQKGSVAEGISSIAGDVNGNNEDSCGAHAEGNKTEAIAPASHSEGQYTQALGNGSHAEGNSSIAQGDFSHAEGSSNKVYGFASHGEGNSTTTHGVASHAEGINTSTGEKAEGAHAEGIYTHVQGRASHTEGMDTKTSGQAAHAEGTQSHASGQAAHAEGNKTKAEGENAHTEGSNSIANGINTHAEGDMTQAYKGASHAEGSCTIAGYIDGVNTEISYPDGELDPEGGSSSGGSGTSSEKNWGAHAEGLNTRALAMAAHAEGEMTKAEGYASHSEGAGTIATKYGQHVQGRFNAVPIDMHKYAHIVGGGTSNTDRKNIHTIDWEGNSWFAGDITIGKDKKQLATQEYVNKRQFKDAIIIGNVLMGATSEMCDILYNDGDDFGDKFTEAYDMAINRGIKTIKILSGTYMSNNSLCLDNEIKIVGENMPNIFFNHDEFVMIGSFITIKSSNVIIEGINFGNDVIEIYMKDYENFCEYIQIHNNIANGIFGYAKKSFFTNNKIDFINITESNDVTTDIITNNIISNNIISEKPQLLFDEDGNLIVTINGISKKFIPAIE